MQPFLKIGLLAALFLSPANISAAQEPPLQDNIPHGVDISPAADVSLALNAPTPPQDIAISDPYQDYCITVITGFPNDDSVARYQFFKLTEDLSVDATPAFVQILAAQDTGNFSADTPVLDIIETIANPVLRQAAPQIVIEAMHHLIDFNVKCEPYISGQVASLTAFDSSLKDSDIIIAEDALYLRQILLDSLVRLGADEDPIRKIEIDGYSNALVRARNAIEFKAYDDDVSDIESLFMEDLDGRLARSNDIINNEIDREVLGDAVILSNDMIENLKRKQKEENVRTLARILNRY